LRFQGISVIVKGVSREGAMRKRQRRITTGEQFIRFILELAGLVRKKKAGIIRARRNRRIA